ncbi:MAG: hypothetical protein ACR2JE_11715 [Acidobacteriaceae bacterium]
MRAKDTIGSAINPVTHSSEVSPPQQAVVLVVLVVIRFHQRMVLSHRWMIEELVSLIQPEAILNGLKRIARLRMFAE